MSSKSAGRMINFLWIGLFFSVIYWILESIRDVLAFERGTLLVRIFSPDSMSLWMRVVVVCMIMGFSAIIQKMRQKAESEEREPDFLGTGVVIFIGFLFGLGYWVLEAIRDTFVYHRGPLMQQIFTPDPLAFWMRILAICILVLFSIYIRTLTQERQRAEEGLKKIKNTQTEAYEKTVKELAALKEACEREKKSRTWEETELRELIHQKQLALRNVHQSERSHLQQLNSLFDVRIMAAKQEEQKTVYTEVRTLIYTLILLHTQLRQSNNSTQVTLAEYIRGITEYMYHSYQTDEITVHVDNPHIFVPISQAVPFAFVLCEIVFLANKKRELNKPKDPFKVLIKRTDDSALIVKIRHKDMNILPEVENENVPSEYQWLREIIDMQLQGDFWVVRNAQGTDMNIVFKLKI